jgi:hypothetical protein
MRLFQEIFTITQFIIAVYSFYFIEDSADDNPASVICFSRASNNNENHVLIQTASSIKPSSNYQKDNNFTRIFLGNLTQNKNSIFILNNKTNIPFSKCEIENNLFYKNNK